MRSQAGSRQTGGLAVEQMNMYTNRQAARKTDRYIDRWLYRKIDI
jgi:hypothetical protein